MEVVARLENRTGIRTQAFAEGEMSSSKWSGIICGFTRAWKANSIRVHLYGTPSTRPSVCRCPSLLSFVCRTEALDATIPQDWSHKKWWRVGERQSLHSRSVSHGFTACALLVVLVADWTKFVPPLKTYYLYYQLSILLLLYSCTIKYCTTVIPILLYNTVL